VAKPIEVALTGIDTVVCVTADAAVTMEAGIRLSLKE
jgi:hypothetical protein